MRAYGRFNIISMSLNATRRSLIQLVDRIRNSVGLLVTEKNCIINAGEVWDQSWKLKSVEQLNIYGRIMGRGGVFGLVNHHVFRMILNYF